MLTEMSVHTGLFIFIIPDLRRRRFLGMRQNSMPVQIDSEFLRIIPKHLRKRIKSADTPKKMPNNSNS